ncbi:MAG: YybH family protein [Kaistella sp.]
MRSASFIALVVALLTACVENKTDGSVNERQKAIEEIQMAEKDFQKMTAEKGIMEAFWFYADSNAVMKRENDTLIHGRDAIRKYYSAPDYTQALVTWSPDFTNASEQGDFGYTYGKYTWQIKDSTGRMNEFKGVFHTVWKRQADGSWKFVWD